MVLELLVEVVSGMLVEVVVSEIILIFYLPKSI